MFGHSIQAISVFPVMLMMAWGFDTRCGESSITLVWGNGEMEGILIQNGWYALEYPSKWRRIKGSKVPSKGDEDVGLSERMKHLAHSRTSSHTTYDLNGD